MSTHSRASSDSSYVLLKTPGSPYFDLPPSPRSPSLTPHSPRHSISSSSSTPLKVSHRLPRRWYLLLGYALVCSFGGLALLELVKPIKRRYYPFGDDFGAPLRADNALELDPLPRLLRSEGDSFPDEKFIGFLPHSAYHNQRMELQNAFILGLLLNRTVLVPPVWLGQPATRSTYYNMRNVWNQIVESNLKAFDLTSPDDNLLTSSEPQQYPSLSSPSNLDSLSSSHSAQRLHQLSAQHIGRRDDLPCAEGETDCSTTHAKERTFLAWETLVNLSSFRDEKIVGEGPYVEMFSRWDMREKSVEKLLNIKPDDILVLRDTVKDEFQFLADANSSVPLFSLAPHAKFKTGVSLPLLSQRPEKLLLLGSLFGKYRIHGSSIDSLRTSFGRAMAFRNPHIIGAAKAVASRLGGNGAFVSVHARVGDSIFKERRFENMERVWRESVGLLVEKEVVDELWEQVRPRDIVKRGLEHSEESDPSWSVVDAFSEEEDVDPPSLVRRQLTRDSSLDNSPRALLLPPPSTLICRSHRHQTPHLKPLNAPLYLATDAYSPTSHPALLPFFKTFPCTFILSDFDKPSKLNRGVRVPQISQTKRLVNAVDGGELGGFFLPFLEASIASLGAVVVGTPGSTMSEFSSGELAEAYRMDSRK